MAAVNQSADGKTVINNAYVPNYHQGTSKSECHVELPSQNRIRNGLETKCYPQDPRHQKLPINRTSNNRGNSRLLPWHPLSENSKFANPKYLEDAAPEPSHKDPSRIQPGNFSVSMSEHGAKPKSNQPENLIAAGSFQNLEGVRPVSCGEFFRVYVCLICSTFHTDDLQELERHISIDRRKTPIDITASGIDLWCQLCDFKTRTSVEMCQHVASEIHLKRADYYNHIMEGDFCAKEKLGKVHKFYPIFLYCAACEFSTTSLGNLKVHSIDPSHQHKVSCCMYISKFSSAVEYCYCRPCRVKTDTKRELLLHLRSESHMYTLRQYPSNKRMFHDPAQLFFIKEFSLNINEEARVSEQTEGSTFIEGENPHPRKENSEKNDFIENPAPLDLSSKPLPVTCSLCQQVLPEINALVQHFQRIHGVNEDGVKWLISSIKVLEEKSLPTEKPSNTKAGKPKSIVFSPQKSSAADKPLLMQEMVIDFSLPQSSVASGQNLECKPSASSKGVTSGQTMAMVENLNGEKRIHEDSSSSHQLSETERMQNPDKLDRKTEGRTVKGFVTSQQLRETECMQNPGRSSKDFSASQQFYEKEEMFKSSEPYQNLNFNEERVNIDPPSSQQFHSTNYIPSVEEEKVPNSEENLNSSSSQAEVIVEYASDPNADGKSEILTDESSSEHVSAIEGLLTLQFGDVGNPKRKGNDSSSSSFNPPSKKQFCETENVLPLGKEKVPNSKENLNYNSSQAEVIAEYESGPNGKNETETEDFINENFSATDHGSPSSPSYDVSRERSDISSEDHNSVTYERLPAIDDSSIAPASQTHKRLPAKDNSSAATVSSTYERLPATDDSSVAPASPTHEILSSTGNSSVAPVSPTHEPLLCIDDSSAAPASPTYERLPTLGDSSIEHRSPTYELLPAISVAPPYERLSATDNSSVVPASPAIDDSSVAHASPTFERLSDVDNSSVVLLSPISQSDPSTEKRDSSSSDIFVTPERLLTLYDSLNGHTTPTSQSVLNVSRRLYDPSSSDHNSVPHEWSPITHDSFNDEHRSSISQSDFKSSRERNDPSSSDHTSISQEQSPITNDSFNHEYRSSISPSDLNAKKDRNDSSLSGHNSLTHQRSPLTDDSESEHYLATEHEWPKPQSGLKTKRKRSNSSSDEIFIQYEWLPSRARGASSPSRHNLSDSENGSPLNDEQNLNLGEDVDNDSPISRLTALQEPKQPADSNSIINTNSGDSMNGELVLYDCPNEYEAEFTARNSPVASALQIQAGKDIENIEITEVFSLKGRAESSSSSEGEESFNFENIVLSDPEDS